MERQQNFETQYLNKLKKSLLIFIPEILKILKELFSKYYYTLYLFENNLKDSPSNKSKFEMEFKKDLERLKYLLEFEVINMFDKTGKISEIETNPQEIDTLIERYNEIVHFGQENPYFQGTLVLPNWPYKFIGLEFSKHLEQLWTQAQTLYSIALNMLIESNFDLNKCTEQIAKTKTQLLENLNPNLLKIFDNKEYRLQEFSLTPDIFPKRLKDYYKANKGKILNLENL